MEPCKTCRFSFEMGFIENPIYECRRYAPKPRWRRFDVGFEREPADGSEALFQDVRWPGTDGDGCGEHEPKPPSAEPPEPGT